MYLTASVVDCYLHRLQLPVKSKTPEPISAVSGSKFTIFCLRCEDTAREVLRWCAHSDFLTIFWVLYFSEPRAAHFRRAFKIRTKATSWVWPLRIGEEKKKERRWKRKKLTTAAKYSGVPGPIGGHNERSKTFFRSYLVLSTETSALSVLCYYLQIGYFWRQQPERNEYLRWRWLTEVNCLKKNKLV